MAYTPSLRLTLPLTGTLDGTWGDTVNNGITSLTDTAIAGTAAVAQGDVANYTLTSNSGATDEARSMFLNITGALTAARNVVCPTVSKLYFIKNSTTGGFAITLKTTAGTGISIPNGGTIMALYCDGTNVIDAVSYLSALKIGGLTASQAVFSDANKNLVSNAITGTGNVVMSTSPTLVTPALGTPASGVVTNLTGTASININGTVGATTPTTGAFTDLTFSGSGTFSGGTANGVAYLNGSKVLTTGSALTFDGTNLGVGGAANSYAGYKTVSVIGPDATHSGIVRVRTLDDLIGMNIYADATGPLFNTTNHPLRFSISDSEQMRLTSTGLGIGTASPTSKLHVVGSAAFSSFVDLIGIVGSGNSFISSSGGLFFKGYNNFQTGLLTANSGIDLLFQTGSTEQMRLDSSGNVGIGTASPVSRLTVVGSSTVIGQTGVSARFSDDANSTLLISHQLANNTAVITGNTQLAFATGSVGSIAERMRLDSSGNFMVGSTTPYAVSGGGTTLGTFSLGQNARTQIAVSNQNAGSSASAALVLGAYGNDWIIGNGSAANNSNALTFTRSTVEQMRLDSSGNLGLGVVPSVWNATFYKAFQIGYSGSLYASTVGNATWLGSNIYVNNANNDVYVASGYATRANQLNGVHSWSVAPSGTAGAAIAFTQAMTLDASGNLLVGSSSSYGFKLQVESASATPAIYLNRASSTTTDNVVTISSSVGGAGTVRLTIDASGDVKNTNNSYGAISDVKLKENITDATPKLAGLNQVRIVNYNLIGEETKQLGVIAQELEQVFPSLVGELPDYEEVTKTREVPAVLDDEGNEVTPATTEEYTEREATGTVTKSVKYSVFVPMLIKAIQEQQALILSLTARLSALEAK